MPHVTDSSARTPHPEALRWGQCYQRDGRTPRNTSSRARKGKDRSNGVARGHRPMVNGNDAPQLESGRFQSVNTQWFRVRQQPEDPIEPVVIRTTDQAKGSR